MRTTAQVATAVELACRLEASAPKPGNVHPGRSFGDMRFEDFLASGRAIAPVMANAANRPLGRTILRAIEATREATAANTNLGLVLLMAPLARAALVSEAPLRESVREILGASTIDDAKWMYQAIRLAGAGGMGSAPEQDLATEPSRTLLEVMRLASGRDSVAYEYASNYDITFGHTLPMLRRARSDRLEWPDAVVESYLALLALRPDTLIARKLGATVAGEVSEQAAGVVRAGGVRTRRGLEAIKAFDARLSDEHNSRNPGTTADLIAAGILVLLLEDGSN